MNRRLIYSLLFAGVTLTIQPFLARAAERIEFERYGNGPPIYMRLETTGEYGFHDDGWTCIPIYRDLDKVPEDFNLLLVLDPKPARARSAELFLDGFVITEGGPPKLQHYEDRADIGVPILFVDTAALQTAGNDGEIDIDELLALPLMWGIADIYTEQVFTGWQHMIDAAGFLEDGTPFVAGYAHGAATVVPLVETHILFGD